VEIGRFKITIGSIEVIDDRVELGLEGGIRVELELRIGSGLAIFGSDTIKALDREMKILLNLEFH
jgi:hypothetical protein